jgi:HAD superfamily hydrolase (TIGR01509 family)
VSIRAITFDYGGTLDGQSSHWLDRFVALYAECGVDLPFERIRNAFYRADAQAYADEAIANSGLGELMDFHVAVQLGCLGITDDALRAALVERFVARSLAALAESKAIAERLAKRYRLGVISNFYGNVEKILRDAGFGPLLSVVADSSRLGVAKPDRWIFEHAVAALGTAPGETLHVGDSYERDVLAARAAGLKTAWLVAKNGDRGVAGGFEDFRICKLEELPERVDANS